ncbi:hypothetical protein [Nostoc piscinale]|uniref:hypothetical protein n=1 Tax=Nostoc piscinale TaxID=224012 RepID=UPI0039A45C4A
MIIGGSGSTTSTALSTSSLTNQAEGSLDETYFIAKYESETSIFTQHSALSTQHFQAISVGWVKRSVTQHSTF